MKNMILEILIEQLHPRGIYERSDTKAREKEGLPEVKGILWAV